MNVQEIELLVVGAGPAGLSADIEAAQHGVHVTIVDENFKPGGQLIKQTHKFFGSEHHYAGYRGIDIAALLLDRTNELEIPMLLSTPVVGVFDQNIVLSRNGAA